MWYTKFGQAGDVVLSSRIRLARNIDGIPFGAKATDQHINEVIDRCRKALPDLKYIDFSVMSPIDRQALCETHLVSPEMVQNQKPCGLLTNKDCTLCIMLGEEDHIRIQAMAPGFDLDTAYKMADETDDTLEATTDLAFDPQFGYLTCCPTNTGTGLRASVMVHLPALTESKNMERIIRSLSKLGITVRGIYGEGSVALGNIYQISNQVTLGVTEAETIEKLKQIILEIIEKERMVSREIYEQNKFRLEDRVSRAFGILTNARMLTSGEVMKLVSDVRWGINLGILTDINLESLSEVWYNTMPAELTRAFNTQDPTERDLKRAELFRVALSR